jgi:hypothetical protein
MRAGALGVAITLLAGALTAYAGGVVDVRLLQALQLVPLSAAPPPLALPRVDDGRTLTLAELRGRPVLLYFWATW